jgi:hypothetical protein
MDQTILDYTNEPAFANAEYGDVVGFVEYDPESLKVVKTEEADEYHHKSYNYVISGTIKSVKYLNEMLDARSIFYESKPMGTGKDVNPTQFGLRGKPEAAKAIMGAMPSAKIKAAEVTKREAEFNKPKQVAQEGQMSMINRSNDEIQKLMEDAMDAIDEAIASGTDAQIAVNDFVGSQDWYNELNPKYKNQFDEFIKEDFGVTPRGLPKKPAPKAPKAPKAAPTSGLAANISSIVENYYKIKDGDRAERAAARDAIDEILDLDPKLKYIYKNISDINKQLQEAGVITDKTDGCP